MGPKEINLEFAVEALKDYLGKSIYITNDIQRIQKAVADHYKITVEDLKSKKRTANINYPRQIAIYLCRMTTEETIVKIGLEFGNRDHSTVLHAYEKISTELKTNMELKETLEEMLVFVRNEKLKTDYEILLDVRKYSDVKNDPPYQVNNDDN